MFGLTAIYHTETLMKILYFLGTHKNCSREDIAVGIGLQIADLQKIGRQVKILQEGFNVRIYSDPKNGYTLLDWGFFDEEKVKAYFEKEVK